MLCVHCDPFLNEMRPDGSGTPATHDGAHPDFQINTNRNLCVPNYMRSQVWVDLSERSVRVYAFRWYCPVRHIQPLTQSSSNA